LANDAKLAVVAGAAGGMGTATVARLAKDGFRVAALDVNAKGLDAIRPSIAVAGGQTYEVDLTDEKATRATAAQVEREMGDVDVLVSLTGWTADTRFVNEESSYWNKIIAINFQSLLYITHALIPGMIERKRGKIVNVSSDAGKVGQSGEAVYAGCKGAVFAWSKSMARELARFNINVNCISPGPTLTPLDDTLDPDLINRIVRLIPFRRKAHPEEQASGIAFLCSPDADYITGQILSVNGGLTMQ
jgi:2-hydroxycyclohexanecarboxyl-CoA dehydrogenase